MNDYLNKNLWKKDGVSGIKYAVDLVTETAFSDDTQDSLLNLEDNSWWFNYRAEVILNQMNGYFKKNELTLDIGGGNGFTSSFAKNKGYRVGLIEPSPEACKNALVRGIDEVNCGSVTDESIVDESIDQILLLDVLEHIKDDEGFIKLLYKKLLKGGHLLITVPAFMCLWSSEDEAAGHFRRYRINELCKLLGSNGFEVFYKSYFMSFLFIPILFVRVLLEKVGLLKSQSERSEEERVKIAKSQFESSNVIVNTTLRLLEKLESLLMEKSGRVPFGSSIIMVARKIT